MTLVEDLLKDIADVTLIDEDAKSILRDVAKKNRKNVGIFPKWGTPPQWARMRTY